jgi:hypothetical protein
MSKFSINYVEDLSVDLNSLEKSSASTVEDLNYEYSPYQISELKNYNPILGKFFEMPVNQENRPYALNHKYHIQDLNTVVDITTKESLAKDVFVKFSPLLDPIRYMIGKYRNDQDKLRIMPTFDSTEQCHPKVVDTNNAAYTDSFFSFLTSKMLHQHGFLHGIDYYGTAIGVQSKYKMNVTDDLEYLNSSTYFSENLNKLFTISDMSEEDNYNNFGSRRNKNRIVIGENTSTNDYDINDEIIALDGIEDIVGEEIDESNLIPEYVKEEDADIVSVTSSSSAGSSNNSEINYSSCDEDEVVNALLSDDDDDEEEEGDEEQDEEQDEGEEDWQTESDDSQETERYAYIKDFPVQLICLEKCQGTLDELFEKGKLNPELAASALFQINMILLSYQKSFHFTHNDLHTNNIMYNNTDIENLYYKYKNVVYKVPTYGKLFKLIDFGRSIYRFGGKKFCSDSFAAGGDAATQYNCEPYLNEKKPRLDPNYSFDLCRLGCSIYDFIMDEDEPVNVKKLDGLQETIYRWCSDDSGKNVLYKKNGDERYPNFKLYKMIARTVHNHTPEAQLEFPYFKQFATKEKLDMNHSTIDIDALPVYV